jgi:hypothetical protein
VPFIETPMTRSLTDRLAIFKALLDLLMPRLPVRPKVADLGCGHCLFMKAAVEKGCDVTGIDARIDRVPEELRSRLRQQRVQDADLRKYDLILCLGILYHMPLLDQLDLVAKLEDRPAIMDTHCGIGPPKVILAGDEAYRGVVFREGNRPTSSFGNRESFWLIEEDLIRMLGKKHTVLKWLPEHHPGRSFYLLLPRESCRS